ALEDRTLIGAYARFLLVGADGIRLHEEVLYAGGWLPSGAGRFQRLENLTILGGILERALTQGTMAAPHLHARVAEAWPRAQARKDRAGWEERLAQLGEVRDRELAAIAARYESPQSYLFPVAVVCVIPKSEAVR